MDLSQLTQLVALLTGLASLIGAAVTAFISIKKVVKANKDKSLKEIWALVMKLADAAMVEVEKTELKGSSKKDKALAIVNAAAKESGIDITPFTEQLSAYIDQTVEFANTFSKKENK